MLRPLIYNRIEWGIEKCGQNSHGFTQGPLSGCEKFAADIRHLRYMRFQQETWTSKDRSERRFTSKE